MNTALQLLPPNYFSAVSPVCSSAHQLSTPTASAGMHEQTYTAAASCLLSSSSTVCSRPHQLLQQVCCPWVVCHARIRHSSSLQRLHGSEQGKYNINKTRRPWRRRLGPKDTSQGKLRRPLNAQTTLARSNSSCVPCSEQTIQSHTPTAALLAWECMSHCCCSSEPGPSPAGQMGPLRTLPGSLQPAWPGEPSQWGRGEDATAAHPCTWQQPTQ
jgi:hypothetical protein